MQSKKATAPNPSVGADGEQLPVQYEESITEMNWEINEEDFKEMQRRLQRMSDPDYLSYKSMDELYQESYERKQMVIEDLLYAGTYILAGSPKVGKSFMAAQMAYHVSRGIPLWNRRVSSGTALYLALEDPYRRLQDRLYQMFGIESTAKLKLSIGCHPIGKGLEQQLRAFVSDHPDTKLIIIDTLQRVREDGGDTYNYAKDYAAIQGVKAISDEMNLCILLVHHTRKQQATDKFDMISGTNGLFGAADGALVLSSSERINTEAVLDISGRDQQDQRIYLQRNEALLTWEFDRMETQLRRAPPDPVLMALADFITPEHPRWEGTPTELTSALQLELQPNALGKMLNIRSGKLYEDYQIRYESKRSHDGRRIVLWLDTAEA